MEAVSPRWALLGAGPKQYGSVVLPDSTVVAAVVAALGQGGAERLLRTNGHDLPAGSPASTANPCPEDDRVGTNESNRPGGCDNFIVEIDSR